jgi:hypothetical protein
MNLLLAKGKYRKSGHVVGGVLGFLALAIWLFHAWLWYRYDGTRPSLPDASIGAIYPLNTHGHVVYLTKPEDAWLTRLTIIAFGLFGIAFLIQGVFVGGFFPRVNPWEKKQW